MKELALNRIALVLSFAGIYISSILSISEFYKVAVPCGGSGGCNAVASHPSSHALGGIPNSYVGLLAYVVLAALSYWRLASPGARPALILGYVLSAIGTLASIYLTYISLTIIHATCAWCLSSAITMILLLIVHALLMQAEPKRETESGPRHAVLLAVLLLATILGLGVQGSMIKSGPELGSSELLDVPASLVFPPGTHVYGNPAAPITIVEFADLVCPTCQTEYPKLKQYLGQHPGKVKYAFRQFPMIRLDGHQQAAPAAIASEIAAEKGKFWQFVDAIYSLSHEEMQEVEPILKTLEGLGFDPEASLKRIRERNDPAFLRVMKDLEDGSKIGVLGTPTFFIVVEGMKVRASTMQSLYEDLKRPEYQKILNGG